MVLSKRVSEDSRLFDWSGMVFASLSGCDRHAMGDNCAVCSWLGTCSAYSAYAVYHDLAAGDGHVVSKAAANRQLVQEQQWAALSGPFLFLGERNVMVREVMRE